MMISENSISWIIFIIIKEVYIFEKIKYNYMYFKKKNDYLATKFFGYNKTLEQSLGDFLLPLV